MDYKFHVEQPPFQFVRDSVELIEERDSLGHIERTNTRKLMQELADFVYLMDTVTDEHIHVLRMGNLSDPTRFVLPKCVVRNSF